ncbi:MAG: hypothetical protein PWR03_619 [Tenuifilum sp.]|jgi:hypothetical protein|uniref:hypothetical protein n=1 Tax=Tenuifilum sp. TaxID=2760880 RepID=UPI0024AAB416|nr:hypothetical protein [Tenuifilum sp.]MDI3526436.1 hypothetical protein [Tenuifilum sp.]
MKTYKLLMFLLVGTIALSVSSCLEPDDLITANAKSGGRILAPSVVPYKSADVNLTFTVKQGAEVQSVKIYKSFTHNADTTTSPEYLQTTIDISGANVSGDVEKSVTFSWTDLKSGIDPLPKGYVVPDDGADADIGDYFTITYKAVLSDGREVIGATTLVSVANFFAGDYVAHIIYRHPSVGTYPDNIYVEEDNDKTLLAVNGNTCSTSFAIWGPSEKMLITIDPNNNYEVSIATENWDYDVVLQDPYRSDLQSSYDPNTGVITLYYSYMGSGGYRVFWETFTPKE